MCGRRFRGLTLLLVEMNEQNESHMQGATGIHAHRLALASFLFQMIPLPKPSCISDGGREERVEEKRGKKSCSMA